MGTVGLNFGSPTSGTGFDVSATVSQIVANLENVETPWKTQLTALQSQDTAISNLGTLLSNLSNDLGQLTDFTGIMAQKTGSSSNTSVLELTSASSEAAAGTHSVVVNSLAQTSSGCLTELPSATATLSGSITLQAGNGTAQTFTPGSDNNTLSGLAAAINSSGVGITASVLTDATGSRLSLVSGKPGTNGNITITNNSLTGMAYGATTPLTYTSAVTGANASLVVDGVNLSSASNIATGLIPGLTFQLLAPSQTAADGSRVPVQVIIGNNNSGVESAVSQMVSDYNALIRAINTQQGKDSSGNAEPLFGSPTLTLLQQQLLLSLNQQNPNGYLTPIPTDASTALAGSITIQVGNGTAQTVSVPSGDPSLQGLVNAINAANIGASAGITSQDGRSTLSLMSQTAGAAGALTVTPNLSATTDSTTTNMTYTNSSDISTLANLGITVSQKDDGTLTFDASALDSTLNADFSGAVGFFQNVNSWGQSFAAMLNNAGTSSPSGILALAQKSNSSGESTLNAEISKEESLIAARQKTLTAELTTANQIMQALPSQLQGMDELYSAISGYNQNRG